MHYANGREAKVGDRVISLEAGVVGILHTIQAGSETCNGRLARTDQNDPYVTIGACLHVEDVTKAAGSIPDGSVPPKA